ncbi:MAG TPA: heme ABC transporter ATP-binding protein [Stenotrophobium sp.]|jgi:iron complex transport system ATP-binding protein|nr:heme ABC transporter ATP-binding protein [Stenotrophobium sp.]
MLAAHNLSYRIEGVRLLQDVSLQLEPGRLHAIIGPNGAGKSTLLKLLAGDLVPGAGNVTLNGRDLRDWSLRERAQQRAVLPQSESLRFAFTVQQVVELGRLSCKRHGAAQESDIARAALQEADAAHLARRAYPSLSGGERSRVQLARVLAQIWEPTLPGGRYLLLDEPTASQDLAHQHACLRLARKFSAQDVGVLAILHDPNLALRYADEVTLLCCGEVLAQGPAAAVLTQAHLKHAYGVDVEILRGSDDGPAFISVR